METWIGKRKWRHPPQQGNITNPMILWENNSFCLSTPWRLRLKCPSVHICVLADCCVLCVLLCITLCIMTEFHEPAITNLSKSQPCSQNLSGTWRTYRLWSVVTCSPCSFLFPLLFLSLPAFFDHSLVHSSPSPGLWEWMWIYHSWKERDTLSPGVMKG